MKIQYVGKKPTMVYDRIMYEGDLRDVSERQAELLVDESPKEFRIIEEGQSESDDAPAEKKPGKSKAKKKTTASKKTVSKKTEKAAEQPPLEEPF